MYISENIAYIFFCMVSFCTQVQSIRLELLTDSQFVINETFLIYFLQWQALTILLETAEC